MIDFPPEPAKQPLNGARALAVRFRGFMTADGRRAGMCWDEKPRCVCGHRLKTRDPEVLRNVWHDTVVTCVHQESREAPPCNTRQYVALVTFGGSANIKGTGDRAWIVVEINDAHVRAIRERGMVFLERLSLLDCVLPGVDLDLAGANNDERVN